LDKQLELITAIAGEGPTAAYHFDITHSADGTVWLASWGRGLLYLPAGADTFISLDTQHGLPSNVVFAVYEVKPGELWITTENGLVQLTYTNINQPDSFKLRVFDKRDGLSTALFDSEAHHQQNNGTLVFSGYGGIVWFNPASDIAFNHQPPAKPYVSNIKVNGEDWPEFESAWSFSQQSAITLPNNAGAVRIQFVAPSYLAPAKNQYLYRLNRGDWQSLQQPEIQFASLASGEYQLEIKASNNDGVWTQENLSVQLSVPVPWWASWWAFVLYALAIFLVSFLIFMARNRRVVQLNQQLELKVEQRTKQLQQAIDSKEQMFEEISHEFRTPLTLILGKTEQLHNGDAAKNRELGIIRRNAERMYELVEQLLKLAELQAVSKKPISTPVYALIMQTIDNFQSLAQSKNIAIRFDLSGIDKQANFWLVEESVQLIVGNLLSNAVKYSPANSAVLVNAKVEDLQLQLCIIDQGAGFSDPQAALQRFNRQNSSEVGTGLGLSIVQKMVEANHGNLTLENLATGGAKASVNIRAKQVVAVAMNPQIRAESVSHTFPACQILVVEDNPDLRQHLLDILPSQAKVNALENGQQALDYLQKELPDLIISDVMMPLMDGFELCARVKADNALCHIPFILLTAKTDLKSQHYGLQLQADDYIGKPFSSEVLIHKLANRLNTYFALRQKLQHELFNILPGHGAGESTEHKIIQQHLVQHYSRETYAIGELAEHLAISEKTLTRRLKAMYGCTFNVLLKDFRLTMASQQLRAGKTAKDVGFSCGFASQAYFGSQFKEKFGVTPGAYADGAHGE
jgi:signal transduction histidine kinase/CheY-like chemotaxis protein